MSELEDKQRYLVKRIALKCTGADPDIHDTSNPNFAIFMDEDALLKFALVVTKPIIERVHLLQMAVDMSQIPVSGHDELTCSAAFQWLDEESRRPGASPHARVAVEEWEAAMKKLISRKPFLEH